MEFLGKQKYPKDITGTSPDNRIVDERKHVYREWRAVIPDASPFFAESVRIHHNGRDLVYDQDYEFDDLQTEPTQEANQSIYATILFKNEEIYGDVYISYQTFGDPIHPSVLAKYINELKSDKRHPSWVNVLNKPIGFPPEPHKHHISTVYGIGPYAHGLHSIARAIMMLSYRGSRHLYGLISEYTMTINHQLDGIRDTVRTLRNAEQIIIDVKNSAQDAIDNLRTEIITGLKNGTIAVPSLTAEEKEALLGEVRGIVNNKAQELSTIDEGLKEQLRSTKERVKTLEDRPVQAPIPEGTYVTPEQLTTELSKLPAKERVDVLEKALPTLATKNDLQLLKNKVDAGVAWDDVTNKPKITTVKEVVESKDDLTVSEGFTPIQSSTTNGVGLTLRTGEDEGVRIVISDTDGIQISKRQTDGYYTDWVTPKLSWSHIKDKLIRWSDITEKPSYLLETGIDWSNVLNKPTWLDTFNPSNYATVAALNALQQGNTVNPKVTLGTEENGSTTISQPTEDELVISKNEKGKFIFNLSLGTLKYHSSDDTRQDEFAKKSDITWANIPDKPTLSGGGVSDYSQLTGKPEYFKSKWDFISNIPETATRWAKWSEVTEKPDTALRWPTWEEVTNKPTISHDWSLITNIPEVLQNIVAGTSGSLASTTTNNVFTGVNIFSRGIKLSEDNHITGNTNETKFTMTTGGVYTMKADGFYKGADKYLTQKEMDTEGYLKKTSDVFFEGKFKLKGDGLKFFKNTVEHGTIFSTSTGIYLKNTLADAGLVVKDDGNLYQRNTATDKRLLTESDLTTLSPTWVNIANKPSGIDSTDFSKLVTMNTNQVITGSKTFEGAIEAKSSVKINNLKMGKGANDNEFLFGKDGGTQFKVNLISGRITYDTQEFAFKSDLTWDNISGKPTFVETGRQNTFTVDQRFNGKINLKNSSYITESTTGVLTLHDGQSNTDLIVNGATNTSVGGKKIMTESHHATFSDTAKTQDGLVRVVGDDTKVGKNIIFHNGAGKVAVGWNNTTTTLDFSHAISIPDALFTESDMRVKSNIQPLVDISDKLFQLQGYSYTLDKLNDKPAMGVLAQEVKAVFPELVNDTGDVMRVQYDGLVAALITAHNDLLVRYQALEQRVSDLESKLESL